MFRNERQFTGQILKSLEAAGFAVRREVRVGVKRLDILATKDGVRHGVEVKFNSRGLLDDVYKAQAILRLPDVDEMYVCGPRVFMSDDVRALAALPLAGCIIGRHEANKHARERERAYQEGYGASNPSYDHRYGYGPR